MKEGSLKIWLPHTKLNLVSLGSFTKIQAICIHTLQRYAHSQQAFWDHTNAYPKWGSNH